jgi:hypothetical protein
MNCFRDKNKGRRKSIKIANIEFRQEYADVKVGGMEERKKGRKLLSS